MQKEARIKEAKSKEESFRTKKLVDNLNIEILDKVIPTSTVHKIQKKSIGGQGKQHLEGHRDEEGNHEEIDG